MSKPLPISVAMCTYNGERYIAEQLDSMAAQTRLPAELIVCDDVSRDRTPELVEAFARRAPFPVRLVRNPENLGSQPKGITRNFEKAAGLCSGGIIVPCDQDDIWMPEKLARMAAILEADATVGAVFSDGQLVTEAGQPKGVRLSETTGLSVREQRQLARGDGLPLVLSMTKVYGSSLMFRADLLEKILPVPPHWWFDAWVAAVATTHARLVFTPEELYHYRIHPTQSVSASLPTAAERVQRWRSSAAEYWRASEPQLREIHDRLAAERHARFAPYLGYLEGRLSLLRFRATLPSNRLSRAPRVLSRTGDYFRYFNGLRSLVKDLTA